VYAYVCVYMCMRVCVYVPINVCMCVRNCVCMCMYVSVCDVNVSICVYVCACERARVRACAWARVYVSCAHLVRVCQSVYTIVLKHEHARSRVYVLVRTCVHVPKHVSVSVFVRQLCHQGPTHPKPQLRPTYQTFEPTLLVLLPTAMLLPTPHPHCTSATQKRGAPSEMCCGVV
jgi:hypothetical protein